MLKRFVIICFYLFFSLEWGPFVVRAILQIFIQ